MIERMKLREIDREDEESKKRGSKVHIELPIVL